MSYISPDGLLGLSVFFMNLTTVMLLARFVTMRMTKRAIGIDDLALTIAWVFTIAMSINMITAVAFGRWGVTLSLPVDPDGTVDPFLGMNLPDQVDSSKFFYIQEILFVLQLVSSKLAIVLFYRRALIFEKRGFTHWATLVTIPVIALWGLIFFFLYIFQCGTHFSLVWDGPALEELQYCLGQELEVGFAISGLLLDIIIAVLPLHRVFTLKLSLPKKLQVASAFLIGALSVAGAAVRVATFVSEINMVENSLTVVSGDPGMLDSLLMFWSMFEAGFALTCAIMPGLRPMLNKVAKAFDARLSTLRSKSFRNDSTFSDTAPLSVKVSYEVRVESSASDVRYV